ncbi:MAG: ornithine carbamoyltransferase [Candidatus Aenigmatarchaeota archaeon]
MLKDFLSINDIKKDEMFDLFRLTDKLKKYPNSDVLKNKMFCLYFEKPSTRTRISFEVGIKELGGEVVFLDKTTSQLSRGEPLEDTIRTIERYTHVIVARVFSHKDLELMAKLSKMNVINALSDLEHPCQAIADIYTIREKFKTLKDIKIAFVGDGTDNVLHSLLLASTKLGIHMNIACPKGFEPEKSILERARTQAKISGSKISITHEPEHAVKDAHVVYTDVFVSMGQEKDSKKRLKKFLPKYRVTQELLEKAGSALFMHCLPAHRGQEVDDKVIDDIRSIVFDQAENRLHTQKALIIKLLGLEQMYNIKLSLQD